jgi:hypothetical protein
LTFALDPTDASPTFSIRVYQLKIESQDKRIDQLLKGNTFFIPRFQRAYSWEAEHVTKFWDDIIENLSEAYFIGSMVVYSDGRQSLAIVDGQQRITTITILLCAIRDAFKKLGDSNLSDGLQAFIEQKDRDNKTVYVLQTESSFPFLQEEILKSEPADVKFSIGHEEEAIQKAFEIFGESINEQVDGFLSNKEQDREANAIDAVEWLCKVRDTVFDLNVILVALENEDDAYLIFETLNTRGKDLALADLLRNHFSKFLKPKSGVDASKIKWTKVLDTIASAPMQLDSDKFIVHSWQSRYDFVTKAKTFPKIKEAITQKNANGHLDRFVSDAECWRSIFDTEYMWGNSEKDAARSLKAMRIFKVEQPTPGVLSLIRAYRDNRIKYRSLRNALEAIEKFHFSFNAITSSRSSGGISGMYASFGKKMYQAADSNAAGAAIAELVQKLKDREAPLSEFDVGFEQIVHTKQQASQKGLVQYILKKVALHEGQPHIGETDDLTIEHLVPQSKIGSGFSETAVGQIGNLVLVDSETNNLLSTNEFEEKKNILASRGYKLPELLADAVKLDDDLLGLNTRRLSALARDVVWKI